MVGESPHVSSGATMDRQQRGNLPGLPVVFHRSHPLTSLSLSFGTLLIIGAYLMGQDLYKYLIVYLNEYLKTLRKVVSSWKSMLTGRKHYVTKMKNFWNTTRNNGTDLHKPPSTLTVSSNTSTDTGSNGRQMKVVSTFTKSTLYPSFDGKSNYSLPFTNLSSLPSYEWSKKDEMEMSLKQPLSKKSLHHSVCRIM